MTVGMTDVETIERATLDAVPPEQTAELNGWLLGLDRGTVGRAHSAVPLAHSPCDAGVLPAVEAVYARHGLNAVWRVPELASFDALRAALREAGYAMTKPTCVFTGRMDATGRPANADGVTLLAEPDEAWRAVFLGEGFDPVDGASRVQILSRARHAVFACIRVDGQTVAAGMGSYSLGWGSVHGMRTLAPYRGRGLAGRVLAALTQQAQARGMDRLFLQVDRGNTGAQSLYRRAGFAPAWDYAYWARPARQRVTSAA